MPALLLLAAGQGLRADPLRSSEVLRRHCFECHDSDVAKGGLDLEVLLRAEPSAAPEAWEGVLRKLRAHQMPPVGKPRPDAATHAQILSEIGGSLDAAWAKNPYAGRTEALRRLNRTEYQNAIRDLLGLSIDAASLLPKDESSHGFDTVTVGTLSPALLDRQITAAQKISQLAVGAPRKNPGGETYRIRADLTQEEHVEGLTIGTRGGALIRHTFPQEGEYEFQIRLARDRNEEIEGLNGRHEMELLLDRERVALFEINRPERAGDYESVDAKLRARVPVSAGEHAVGVTFIQRSRSLLERRRQPYAAAFNMHRHPRLSPAVYQVSILGPHEAKGPGDTASRRRIFTAWPTGEGDELACARQILEGLVRRAYRRPATPEDLERPLAVYQAARAGEGFEAGIEAALSAILASPLFLFRVEEEAPGLASGRAHPIPDTQLASRLSFLIWSSIPDEELLRVAERGELRDPEELGRQTRRMLADPKAGSLAGNFASQWLHLGNLDSLTPDPRLFPDFDDNLRQALRRETELLFQEVVQEDRSVLELIRADHTYLNGRLARHYGIPHVQGSHFRKVALAADSHRGGLLRHGSILSVTSYATRTSPVLRGNWILGNLLGAAPPPPPADVPALQENSVSSKLSARARLAEHRANAACASCHDLMDPVGFALEHYDALGRWRELEEGEPVDASGGLPDGSRFTGVGGLEENLLNHPELFAGALAEKLLTFGLGRGVEPRDGPAIRQIVEEARRGGWKFSALVTAVVRSVPFTMKQAL